ncbi:MAG: hypothetical protein K2X39_03900, partial [Silvanigrellaceae bacterium]|nr:hypothetical protein [Silvanigrellaceae bacterium]
MARPRIKMVFEFKQSETTIKKYRSLRNGACYGFNCLFIKYILDGFYQNDDFLNFKEQLCSLKITDSNFNDDDILNFVRFWFKSQYVVRNSYTYSAMVNKFMHNIKMQFYPSNLFIRDRIAGNIYAVFIKKLMKGYTYLILPKLFDQSVVVKDLYLIETKNNFTYLEGNFTSFCRDKINSKKN